MNASAYTYPNLLVSDGSFEIKCQTLGLCGGGTYSGGIFTQVGDWNFSGAGGGGGNAVISIDANASNTSDGNHLLIAVLHGNSLAGGSVAGYWKNKDLLTGGTLSWDVIRLFDADPNGGTDVSDTSLSIDLDGVGTIYSASGSSVVGFGKSVNIPPGSNGRATFYLSHPVANDRAVTIWFDNVRFQRNPTLLASVIEQGDPWGVGESFKLSTRLNLQETGENVSDASCVVDWDGDSNSTMTYSSTTQTYSANFTVNTEKTVSYSISCTKSGHNPGNASGTVSFIEPLSDQIVFTDVSNVTHEIFPAYVNAEPTNETDDIIFSINNVTSSSVTVPISVFNSLTDGRQYFLYSATTSQYLHNTWSFDDSGTFGNFNDTPMQKIWDENNQRYSYSQDYLIGGFDTVFFKLVYKNPYEHFFGIGDSEKWINYLHPTVDTTETIPSDVFTVNAFSNMRSIFIKNIPDISGDVTQAYEMQFTAWADDNTTVLLVGQTSNDSDTTTGGSITLTTEPHTYSVTLNALDSSAQILLTTSESTPRTIHIRDYAIVPRGYFTQKLSLFKSSGDPLDLFLVNNHSKQYVKEGKPFKITTQAYDREGKLVTLKIEGFFDTVGDDVNKVSTQIQGLETGNETLFDFDQDVNGIIDLSGNASTPTTPRDFIVKATLVDDEGNEVSVQSQAVKFVQYPYFPGDISINFLPTEKRKGKNPAGIIQMNMSAPETLLGYDIRIWDSNSGTSISNPLHQERIYKGTDFECTGGNCGLQFTVDDFLFESTAQTNIAVTAMLNTENFSLTNPLIQSVRSILVSAIDFDVAKIHQVNERADRTYKPTEEIPLVLILRDQEATNISKKISVYMTLGNCDSTNATNCVNQTTQFTPTGFAYDDKTNLNYFFFRNLWYMDDGSLLPDGNYVSFHAHVTDKLGITDPRVPVLADKCALNGTDFWSTSLASIINGFGCAVPQDSIVTQDHNSGQERALKIDSSRVTTAPSQELFACINTDTNNVVGKPLEANLYCFTWYQVAEKPIDDFRVRLTNKYSDVSDVSSTKQYVEFNIPYELIALNDLPLLKQELETNQQTSINTVGEFIQAGLGDIARGGIKNLGIENIVNGSNVITNIGADMNLNQAFDPSTVGGFTFYVIKGIPFVNAQDFRFDGKVVDNFDNIDRAKFLEYLSENKVGFKPSRKAEMQLIVNSFTLPTKVSDPTGQLLIDEEASNEPINQSNADANTAQRYNFVPSILFFTIQNTMFFENFSGNDTKAVNLKITTLIGENFFAGLNGFVREFTADPKGALIDVIFNNLGIIIIVLGLVFIISVIIYNLRSRGG